ncbi:MAG: NADH:flavin oxidoreductase/NADH oxidase [Nevskia sp.]|nr:NADH:flavin oxidoreductase/NADH oxidase [Nevskia sp.]
MNDMKPMGLEPLYTPLQLPGGLTLPNRIAMLPMTRVRAEIDGTPSDLMVEFFAQRASAGLLFTDSTPVSAVGRGFLNAPAMFTTEHALGWRKVTDAVHAKGGRIILQINHVGRVNNLQFLQRNIAPVAPSAVRIPRNSRMITINIPRITPYEMPRALETEEIPLVADEFERAARLAVFAGFDGVEVHADSGYLIHQFLSTNVNQRTDRYGGSVQNRARFALEVLDKVIAVNGPEYVSIKLTPGFQVHNIEEDDIPEKYSYFIDQLNQRKGLSFLHLYFGDLASSEVFRSMRQQFNGRVLAEGSLKALQYAQMVASGALDFTGFARAFISNPDLPERLRAGLPISQPDMNTTYSLGAEGYTDYPKWNAADPEGSVVGPKQHDDADALLQALNI